MLCSSSRCQLFKKKQSVIGATSTTGNSEYLIKVNLLSSFLITHHTKDLLYSQADIESTLYLVKEKRIKNKIGIYGSWILEVKL